MTKREEMFKSIMEDWYCASEEFLEFKEKDKGIVMAYGTWSNYGFDTFDLDFQESYEDLFGYNFLDPIKDYILGWGEEDCKYGIGYFNEEQFNFLKEYLEEN